MSRQATLPRAEVEVDRSIAAVRLIFALIGATITAGARPDGQTWGYVVYLVIVTLASAAGLSLLAPLLRSHWRNTLGVNALLQALDTVAALGLVHILGAVAPDTAWVLFAVPIVVASLRLGATGVVTVWLGASAGYLALFWFDFHVDGREALGTSIIFERPGILLAVAACVAVLTRWLQEGWTNQALAAEESEARLSYVAILERAGRELQQVSADETVPTSLKLALGLDLVAATATHAETKIAGQGDLDRVPFWEPIEVQDHDAAELTTWTGNNGSTVYSISMFEAKSACTITGWSAEPLQPVQIDSFASLIGLTAMHRDLAQLLERAYFEADHDPLTGLANRSLMDRELSKMASRDQHLAMLFLDLDKFKQVNDTHGHQLGDEVLKFVANRLERIVGNFGLVARFGGDEFVVALCGDRAKAAVDLTAHIHEAINGTRVFGGIKIELGVSIGLGLGTGPIEVSELVQAADRAVFAAKEAGRGTTRTLRVGAAVVGGDATGAASRDALLADTGVALDQATFLSHPVSPRL